mgnify:CR=1 FL=1
MAILYIGRALKTVRALYRDFTNLQYDPDNSYNYLEHSLLVRDCHTADNTTIAIFTVLSLIVFSLYMKSQVSLLINFIYKNFY